MAVLLVLGLPVSALGQEPPDSIISPLPDSVAPGVTVMALDSGTVVDTVYTTHPDSVFRVLPPLTVGTPGGAESGVTVWGPEDLLGNSALTLLELLAKESDLLPFRYGDYGSPEAVLGAGMTGGRVRIFVDGFEELPLTGAVPDLSRVALAGVREVRAERGGGELRIYLASMEPDDPRPMSRVEAGTGDLNTNLFRGTFLHPRAFGGTLGLSIERKDSEGRGGGEPGSRQSLWFRYAAHRGDDRSLSFDFRQSTTEGVLDSIPPSVGRSSWVIRARTRLTPTLVAEAYTGSTSVSSDDDGLTPLTASTAQHGARLSWERGFGALAPSDSAAATPTAPGIAVVATDTTVVAPVDTLPATPVDTMVATPVDSAVAIPVDPAAIPVDTTVVTPIDTAATSRDTLGAAVDTAGAPLPGPAFLAETDELPEGWSGRLWSRLEGRLFTGTDLPSRRLDFEAGADVERLGGFAVEYRQDAWTDPVGASSTSVRGVRAWSAPIFGLSLFGGWDSGVRGARIVSPRVAIVEPDTTEVEVPLDTFPRFHLADRTALRAGARLQLGPLDLRGTWHRVETDSVLPLGLLGARRGAAVGGDEVTGFEVAGRLALPVTFEGLSLVGSLLQWDTEGLYRPGRRYTGGLDFHNIYKAGHLELWTSLLVEGRDSMLLPQTDPLGGPEPGFLRVPFYQSWDFWVQVRVLTVRIFIRSENMTLRGRNQDFPGRLLPQTRTVYGVRWTLWN
jgi:hypothetical protein